jgi:hypothetical protein
MANERETTIDIGGREFLAPVIGAVLTNAFYAAELLHSQKGVNPPREDIHHEVMKIWLELTAKIVKISQERIQ